VRWSGLRASPHGRPPRADDAVGINSGQPFVTAVASQGPLLLITSALVLLTTVAIVLGAD
jgi:hypothetical protein